MIFIFVSVAIDSLINLGDALHFKDRFNTSAAFEYYNEAFTEATEYGDQEGTFRSLERLVNLYSVNDEDASNWDFYLKQLEDIAQTDAQHTWCSYHRIRFYIQPKYRKGDFDVYVDVTDWIDNINFAVDANEHHLEIKFRGLYAVYLELSKTDYPEAIILYKRNIELCKKLNNEEYDRYLFSNCVNLGNLYQTIDSFEMAIAYFKEGLSIGPNETRVYQNEIKVYGWISETYKDLGQLDSALHYSELKYDVLDESDRSQHDDRMSELEEQYQNDVLTENLKTEQVRLTRNRLYLALSSLVALFGAYFLYQKRKENKQALVKFSDEKIKAQQQAQLDSINARLDGEEQERIRVAQVLHDGIASQLTAADFQLSALRTASAGSYDASIDRSVDLIRDTSSQVRELSHELVPPVLLKLGLIPALEDLCHKYSSDKLNFSMASAPDDVEQLRIDIDTSFTLYLITQELLQNILKHSDASEVSIRHYTQDKQLTIEITDNSSISLPDDLSNDQSLGLISMRTRIESLGGSFNRIYNSTDNKNIQRIEIPYK